VGSQSGKRACRRATAISKLKLAKGIGRGVMFTNGSKCLMKKECEIHRSFIQKERGERGLTRKSENKSVWHAGEGLFLHVFGILSGGDRERNAGPF